MATKQTRNDRIDLRISESDKIDFVLACGRFGVAYQDMLREMIGAFSEGRLTITVPPTQLKILKGVHNVA